MDGQRGRCDSSASASGTESYLWSSRGYDNLLLRLQRKLWLWDDLSRPHDWADFASIMAAASQIL